MAFVRFEQQHIALAYLATFSVVAQQTSTASDKPTFAHGMRVQLGDTARFDSESRRSEWYVLRFLEVDQLNPSTWSAFLSMQERN